MKQLYMLYYFFIKTKIFLLSTVDLPLNFTLNINEEDIYQQY